MSEVGIEKKNSFANKKGMNGKEKKTNNNNKLRIRNSTKRLEYVNFMYA